MANIKIPRSAFEKEIGKLDANMQNKIAMFGTTLEKFDNNEIELEIFPNRPDLLSYQGFKRSFLSYLGKKQSMKKYIPKPPKKNYIVNVDSSVKNIRPYTACAIIEELNLDNEKIKEIIDLQEKLHNTVGRKRKKLAIGIYPLEKIKLPISYQAIEPDKINFTPLESENPMSGLQILQKHPTGKEYAHLLAGKMLFPVFIDANKEILSMPPIINSKETGRIIPNTKNVFVECSGFDFETLKKCLNIIVATLRDMGGEIYQMEIKYPKKEITPDMTLTQTKLNIENAQKLLGIKLDETQVKEFLERMGYEFSKKEILIPPYRLDVLHEVDLIEDIAIAYGYDQFEPKIPKISTIGKEDKMSIINKKISEILIGLEFLEVSNYHLTNKKNQFINMGINENQIKEEVKITGSKTDYTIMRKNLSHYLLKNLSDNIDSEYPQKIFEIGKIFINKQTIIEKEKLGIAITPGNFTQIKQIIEYLFRMLDFPAKIEEPKKSSSHYIEGRSASIIYQDKEIGSLGEIHPKILKNWKIKMPVAIAELNLKPIYEYLI